MNLHLRNVGALALLATLVVADVAQAQSSSSEQGGLFNEVQDNRRFWFLHLLRLRLVARGRRRQLPKQQRPAQRLQPRARAFRAWKTMASLGNSAPATASYDWNGRNRFRPKLAASQQQTFITSGIFRRAHEYSAWSGGLVSTRCWRTTSGSSPTSRISVSCATVGLRLESSQRSGGFGGHRN